MIQKWTNTFPSRKKQKRPWVVAHSFIQNGQDLSDNSEMDEYLSQQQEAKKAVGRSS
jgi:hypothetical protein